MKRTFLTTTLLLLGFMLLAQEEAAKLEQALFNLPDVSFKRLPDTDAGHLQYDLLVRQPTDHKDPAHGHFYQRVRLTHHGFDRPAVMNTQGYFLHLGKNEIEAILDANYLNIEHRYFGPSTPDSVEWQYLTLEQVTADLHHINELFRQVYSGPWISTGISKGGQTTIFYRYFYPNDVAVSIPYVAPFTNGLEDTRIYTFLDTVGPADCRKKIQDFQLYMLKNREEALAKIKWFSKGANLKYEYLGSLEKAFEYTVLEYSFSFWQWGGKCDEIPDGSDFDVALEHFLKISDIGFFSDRDINHYATHYYQAGTEMGYYGYNIEPFKKYLTQFKSNPSAVFAPKGSNPPPFDNSLIEKTGKWLEASGNNMLYIYGAADTWSANRITPSKNVNSMSYILGGKDHGQARIRNMSETMQQDFAAKIKAWTGLDANMEVLKK
ncbi:MAG: hypothetical protein EP344_09865 [Bacteroidetes bacterium]|nr:MAG: hypothetical protein EP344_09865 [Bacteroidota bacterium]